jgi:hypothetical protein
VVSTKLIWKLFSKAHAPEFPATSI